MFTCIHKHYSVAAWKDFAAENKSILGVSTTVLPAKSGSDIMFCLQSYQGLIIDRSLLYEFYPQDRVNTQVIYRFQLAQVKCNR